jgi:hypothetical protein
MDRIEKASELIEQAKKVGFRLEFHDGLNMLKAPASVDPDVITLMLEQLSKYLPEIRSISQRRAVAALAKKHVGSRIFTKEYGAGTLVEASEDGVLTVTVSQERRRSDEEESRSSRVSITANAESLLIIVDQDDAEETSSPADQKPESELPRKKLFGLI